MYFCRNSATKDVNGQAGTCDVCLCEIYGGDPVYVIDGFLVCPDCIEDYAKEMFRWNLTFGEYLRRK